MCLAPKIDIPDPPPVEQPPLPARTAEKLHSVSPNPIRKALSSRRIGKSALVIDRSGSGLSV